MTLHRRSVNKHNKLTGFPQVGLWWSCILVCHCNPGMKGQKSQNSWHSLQDHNNWLVTNASGFVPFYLYLPHTHNPSNYQFRLQIIMVPGFLHRCLGSKEPAPHASTIPTGLTIPRPIFLKVSTRMEDKDVKTPAYH